MSEKQNITDKDLLAQLKESFIDPNQKKELESFIPEMTNKERDELIALINRSHEEAVKDDPEYQEKLSKLNAEYDKKIKKLSKESIKEAYAEEEKEEGKEEGKELKEMEGEIANISTESRGQVTEKLQPNLKLSHVIRNMILIFLSLIVVAGTVLFIIYSL